jgi:hypothetical protein
MKIAIKDQDIVFLSYDEPNAEKNYADLLHKIPWAKRVHGVKGSDAAHKACAAASDTEYFVTVDGDNIVNADFLNVVVDLEDLGLDQSYVFSWCGKINVNGLMYGNGGLKLWTREFVNNMRTHENSDPDDAKGRVEFCFDDRYYQFNENYSVSHINASPFQAWRAGFREGVKMSLNQGAKMINVKDAWWQNYHRLLIWSSVGRDVENGFWSMLGAREGCYLTNCADWDYANVRDFDYLTRYWQDNHQGKTEHSRIELFDRYTQSLTRRLGLEIADMTPEASKFFKTVYINTPRVIRQHKK